MKIQAEISLYPLREKNLTKPVRQFIEVLENNDLKVATGAMSSIVSADSRIFFESLRKAFEQVAKKYDVVVTTKISNTCPEVSRGK
jgi:uncharacterized protein YqgV (UPF0045/DUF77 family)